MIHFAVNPIFQIGKKTSPLISAALIGCLANAALFFLLARGGDASGLAIAQSGAAIASLAALLAFASRTRPRWPAARDLGAIAISTGINDGSRDRSWEMMRTLAAEVAAGLAVIAASMLVFDVGGIRRLLAARLFAKPAEAQ